MKIFNLPDLGEGLADAEIKQWYIAEGDVVSVDQPLLSVETAKALVDIPSPYAGKIIKCYAKVGDVIATKAALVAYEAEQAEVASNTTPRPDAGTVVGALATGTSVLVEDQVIIGSHDKQSSAIKILPAVRALAKSLNVDLSHIKPSHPQGHITAEDVKRAASLGLPLTPSYNLGEPSESLTGVRRMMALAMMQSHREIVPVVLVDEADVHHWQQQDITVRLIQAVLAAIAAEPALNAWFDAKTMQRRLFKEVNLGIAIDSPEGLFVPVLHDVVQYQAPQLRTKIDELKMAVKQRSLTTQALQGATFTLSNFGSIAGRFGTPIIVPPTVAILGVGRMHEAVVACQGQMAIHRMIPLSLTFDHRVITGGEASRFLGAVIKSLEG